MRELYPDVKAVFCDTGLEYPEIKQHVKSFDNVEIIRPKKTFKQVVEEYGWVFPSKRIAENVQLQYQIDFDTLRYTYIPNLEDIKNDKEASEIAEEAKDDFMEVF